MAGPKTVLVLGAGASADYGFPLGRGLRDLVCKLLEENPGPVLEQGFSAEEVMSFSHALSRSGYTSVDWFLEKHVEFLEIGRASIAAALIPFEEQARLFPYRAPSTHWYEVFFNKMWSGEDCSLVDGNHITVLTFNYDRSLEFYLSKVAATRSGLTSEATLLRIEGPHRTVVAQGPTIIHLHGQLGALQGPDPRPYMPDLNAEMVAKAAQGLQLLTEANPDSQEFQMGRSAIDECERLYFLGFGFHPLSVQRLADLSNDDLMSGKEVSGTNAGISRSDWSKIHRDVLMGRWKKIETGNSVFGFLQEHSLIS